MESLMFVVDTSYVQAYLKRFSSILTSRKYPKNIIYELASCLQTETDHAKGNLFFQFVTDIIASGHENFVEKGDPEKWNEIKKSLNKMYGNQ